MATTDILTWTDWDDILKWVVLLLGLFCQGVLAVLWLETKGHWGHFSNWRALSNICLIFYVQIEVWHHNVHSEQFFRIGWHLIIAALAVVFELLSLVSMYRLARKEVMRLTTRNGGS